MYSSFYSAWNHVRAKAIIDFYGHKFFSGKRLLDLGSGNGDFAATFARLGAHITVCDARDANIALIQKNHPYFNKVVKSNLEVDFPFAGQEFDMVFSLGLLCHLKNYEKHINDICNIAEHIVLETEIFDSNDPSIRVPVFEDKAISDFSFTGEGSIVSAKNIESKLSHLGATFKRLDEAKLNSGPFKYDWQEANSGRKQGNRRFWFIKRDKYLRQLQANQIATERAKDTTRNPHVIISQLAPLEITSQHNPSPASMNFNSFENVEPNVYSYGLKGQKKKIKLFIITYNSDKLLHENLISLFKTNITNYNYEINIINNHSNFSLDEQFKDKVNVLHNDTRPDFSTGHLARNWNQCIINGFKDLNNPDCDILTTVQVDTTYEKDCFSNLENFHNRYSFITDGVGDNMCSYTAEAVKKIGLWDERFCNIGFQEADYFIRALMYNKTRSSINDRGHGRVINPIGKTLVHHPAHGPDQTAAHHKSAQYHTISLSVFKEKYGVGYVMAEGWKPQLINNPPRTTLVKNYVYYPYFEKNVEDLVGKNYVWTNNTKYFD
jgi:SAM-dependent methyltransferase